MSETNSPYLNKKRKQEEVNVSAPVVKPTEPTPVDSPYSVRRAELDRMAAQKTATALTTYGSADENAQINQLAEEHQREVNPAIRPPNEFTKSNKDLLQANIDKARNTTALSRSPMLTKWLQDNENARIANDDIENLSTVEDTVKNLSNMVKRWGDSLGQISTQSASNTQLYLAEQHGMTWQERYNRQREPYYVTENEEGELVRTSEAPASEPGVISHVVRQESRYDAFMSATIGTYMDATSGQSTEESLRKAADYQMQAAEFSKRMSELHPQSEATQRGVTKIMASEDFGELAVNVSDLISNDPVAFVSMIAETAGDSLIYMIPAGIATAMSKNPRAGAAAIGLTSYSAERNLDAVGFFTEKGYDLNDPADIQRLFADETVMSEANERGHLRGVVIGLIDAATLGIGGKVLNQNPIADVLLQAGVQAIGGGGGETLATLGVGDELKPGEIALEALAEFVTTPIDLATGTRKYYGDKRRAAQAEEQTEALKGLNEVIEASKVRERTPEQMRDFVESMTGDTNVENLYVPAEKFDEFFQSQGFTPEQIAEVLPGVTVEQIDRALRTNEDVIVPTATYLDKIAGTDMETFFVENSRLDPSAMTPKEAEEFVANADTEKLLAEAKVTAVQDREALETETEIRLYDNQLSALVNAGQSRSAAKQQALLLPAFYRAIAERSGQTIEQIVERYGEPTIRGAQPDVATDTNIDQIDRDLAALKARRATPDGLVNAADREYADALEKALTDNGLDPETVTADDIRALGDTFNQSVINEEVRAFASNVREDLGLHSLALSERDGVMSIDMIAVNRDEMKQGKGTEAMERVINFADRNGLVVTLTTGTKDDNFGTTSTSRLKKFYKRFGFVENKGRNKDFARSGNMYRDPEQIKSIDNRGAFDPEDPNIFNQSAPAQAETSRSDLGFFSAVEKSVITMKVQGFEPSKKNPEGKARGADIWAKLKKEGVKKEELEWLGVEEFLTTDPNAKFTREEVVFFVRENGVQVEETLGDQEDDTDGEGVEFNGYDAEIDEDSDNWALYGEDLASDLAEAAYDEDHFDRATGEELLDKATDFIINEHSVDLQEGAEDGDVHTLANIEAVKTKYADELKAKVEELASEEGEERARDQYFDNPYMNYETQLGGNTFRVHGNDDIGYRAWVDGEHVMDGEEIYSINEMEIQLTEYARDQGIRTSEDDENVAKWGDYVMDGAHDNYREVKLTLPNNEAGDFYEEAHFPDPNIVAFLRVDDRQLESGAPEKAATPQPEPTKMEGEFTFDIREDEEFIYIDIKVGDTLIRTQANHKSLHNAESVAKRIEDIKRQMQERNAKGERVRLSGDYVSEPDGTITKNPEPLTKEEHKTYFIDEMQSDWHQAGRQQGYTEKGDEVRGIPDAPFKGDAWISLALKRAVTQAVEQGYTQIAWPNAQVLADRWSERYIDLYDVQYNKKMPSIVKKLTGQKPVHMNDALKTGPTPMTPEYAEEKTEGYWIVEITPELKEKVKTEGLALFQDKEDAKRGRISIPQGGVGTGETVIDLFKQADLSTFLHESSHLYLSILQDMAAQENATPEIQEMLDATTKWWTGNVKEVAKEAGVSQKDAKNYLKHGTTGDDVKDKKMNVATQEQWARAFETYLLEGKAPNQKLAAAFEQFRAWLMHVYRKIKGDLEVNISDDIRQVFDMLLATDEEIARAGEDNHGDMLAESAAELGVTEEDYAALQALHQEAQDQQAAKTIQEAMRPIKHALSAEYRERKKEVREEATKEVNARPVYRAIEWMGNKRWLGDDGEVKLPKGMKLNKDQLRERYGPGIFKTLPRGSFRVYAPEGMDIDEAAGWFGYSSGDELVKAMENAPKRVAAIENETDRRMTAEINENEATASAAEQATQAFHTDKRGDYIAAELRTMNKVLGRDEETKQFSTASYARQLAKRTLGAMKSRDAVASNRYLMAERRAAEEAQKAFANGDREAAATAKRQQLFNHMMYVESKRISAEVGKLERLAKRLGSKGTRKNLANDYLGAIDDILEQYDFRKVGPGKEQNRARMLAYVEMMKAEGRENEIAIPQYILDNAKVEPYMTLPVDELRGIYSALKNIESTARRAQKLIDAQNERDMEQVRNDIGESFAENVKPNPPERVETAMARIRKQGREYVNLILKADTLLREVDGHVDDGAAHTNIKQPIDLAYARLQARQKEASDRFLELTSVYTKKEQIAMGVKKFIPELNASMSKWDLIAIAQNMGNADNIQRLTDKGVRWHYSEAQLQTIVDNYLNTRDMDYVQSTWDYIDTFWGDIVTREKRVTGVSPEKVEPQSLVTKHGTYKGGYFPLKYDPRSGEGQAVDESTEDLMNNMAVGRFSKAQTRNGHTKERAAASGKSALIDINTMYNHVNAVLHDLEMSEPVTNAWRILQDPGVKGMFFDYGKQIDHQSLEIWVQDVASGQVGASDIMSKVARNLKTGFTMSKLLFNFSTVLVQLTGAAQSMVEIGSKDFVIGVSKYAPHPLRTANEVRSASPFMRERETTFQKDARDAANAFKVGPTSGRHKRFMSDVMIPYGFAAMVKTQFYGVDMPTWLGAYEAALKDNSGDEANAIYRADRAVARAQSSGLFTDQSAIERGTLSSNVRQSEVVRLFTTLASYMFAKFNVAYERTGRTEFTKPLEAVHWALDMVLLFTVEAVMYGAIKGTLPGMGDDSDDEEGWLAFLAKETGLSIVSTLPFARDATSLTQGYSSGGAYGSILETAVKPLMEAAGGEVDKAAVKSAVNAVGMTFKLPSTATNRIVDAWWRQSEGDDVAPIEYIMGRR